MKTQTNQATVLIIMVLYKWIKTYTIYSFFVNRQAIEFNFENPDTFH